MVIVFFAATIEKYINAYWLKPAIDISMIPLPAASHNKYTIKTINIYEEPF